MAKLQKWLEINEMYTYIVMNKCYEAKILRGIGFFVSLLILSQQDRCAYKFLRGCFRLRF